MLYVCCALLLVIYAGGTLLLLLVYWRQQERRPPAPPPAQWPHVAVQLPIYNERHVVRRLLAAVACLRYPHDRLTIQILDDSTDETSALLAEPVAALQGAGLRVQHIRRAERTGYKAGALAHGLAQTDAEYVAVLDADFIPAPDFLRRTIPHLAANPDIGMVQTRWGHLNRDDSLLTMGQALALDGHFVVEQTARSRAGWLMNFNGSGGVWRADCIRESGGWSASTLTEDLDLSYRAQLAGWRFLYLPDVVVPAELPPQIAAYKQQQARWAQGSTQTLVRLLGPLWRARLTLTQRIMATLHLCQYIPHPLMILLLLLTPPLLLAGQLRGLPLGPLGLVGLGPPLVYVTSQYALYPDWRRRLLAFPVLLALGTGIAWTNTRAILAGLRARPAEFRRTPKFAAAWTGSRYALGQDRSIWGEVLLALYALWGLALAFGQYPALIPYLTLYCVAFASMAGWGLRDDWLLRRQRKAGTL